MPELLLSAEVMHAARAARRARVQDALRGRDFFEEVVDLLAEIASEV